METDREKDVLEAFMKEFFPFKEFLKIGFFKKEMEGDYAAQAERVRFFYGYKSVYEFGAKEVRAHITYDGERPKGEPFVTTIPSIYET